MQEPLEVEVVDQSTRAEAESIRESIQDEWVGATAAYKLANLTKSSFQEINNHCQPAPGNAGWHVQRSSILL